MTIVPKSLRWQLALAMGGVAAGATTVVLAGMIGFYFFFERYIMQTLSPELRSAIDAWNRGEFVTPTQIETIKQFYSTDSFTRGEIYALIGFCGLGISIGMLAGAYFGARVSKPIESVAEAARRISAGELGARAKVENNSIQSETYELVANFNSLAEGLHEAERELSESASAIAHELRTPVTIIKARLQAVRDGVFQLTERELTGLIAQIDLLAAIIDDMRILSLAGAKQLELHCVKINLAEEAKLGVRALEAILSDAGVKLEMKLDDAPAFADPARVRQMLNALVENARLYAAKGRTVRIETKNSGHYVSLAVLDRGPGLSKDQEYLVFDRFWRGDSSRSRETGGTGLGLTVVKTLMDAHGGSVSAGNRPGGGAIFELHFPLIVDQSR